MQEAAEVLRIDPRFSLERFAKGLPYKNQADTDRVVEALRQGGVEVTRRSAHVAGS